MLKNDKTQKMDMIFSRIIFNSGRERKIWIYTILIKNRIFPLSSVRICGII